MRERCLLQAREKAELVAKVFGLKILGIRAFSEGSGDETRAPALEGALRRRGSDSYGGSAPGAVLSEELGLSVSHTMQVTVQISARFLVGLGARSET